MRRKRKKKRRSTRKPLHLLIDLWEVLVDVLRLNLIILLEADEKEGHLEVLAKVEHQRNVKGGDVRKVNTRGKDIVKDIVVVESTKGCIGWEKTRCFQCTGNCLRATGSWDPWLVEGTLLIVFRSWEWLP